MPKKILVIDDSKLLHRFHELALKSYSGCQIDASFALNGQEGLARLHEHPDTDLILLDINMPGMSGLEFLRQVRADDVFHNTKVVLQSTEDHEDDIARGLKAGATGYLTKPFTVEQLHELLDGIFADVG